MSVKYHLKHVPLLRKLRDRLRKRPNGLRGTGEEQQGLLPLLPVLQNLHIIHLRPDVKAF